MYGFVFFFQAEDGIRDADVTGVQTCALPILHAQITIDAARARKHVVCEKPLCLTLEEADAMIDACRRAGVLRSEERRVGKESRSRWTPMQSKKKIKVTAVSGGANVSAL